MSTPPLSQIANLSYSSPQHINGDKIKQNFFNSLPVAPYDVTPAIPRAIQCEDTSISSGSFFRNASIRDFKDRLETKEGLEEYLNLLKISYDEGTSTRWQDAIRTDIILIPKMSWITHKKYPDINLKVLTLGVEQLAGEIIDLTKNNVQSAKFIFGTNGLDTEANHFLMADYYLDTSSEIKTASIIFFDPTDNDPVIKSFLDNQMSELLRLEDTLKIKYLYVSLNIQKSTVDCMMFSLEIAKAAHKSTAKMQHFHQSNITDQLETAVMKQLYQFNIATQDKFDPYIPTNMMKHCQSSTRMQLYNDKLKIDKLNPAAPVNKKAESIVDRAQRYTKNKYFNDKFSKKTNFSIEKQRISLVQKILKHWDEINGSS